MDFLLMEFPESGVRTWVFLPPLVAFAVSFVSSMGGVSGAFFLLPFQMSVLHFVSPSVTSTNFLYNVLAIPSGVFRYIREGRMVWPLAGAIIAGTLPGVFVGYYVRVRYLPDPRGFRLFVGCVLLYIGLHLLYGIWKEARSHRRERPLGSRPANSAGYGSIRPVSVSVRRIVYSFGGETHSIGTPGIFGMALVVGIVGGAYGIGGGSILAPFCVAVYGLPVHTVAGAALLGTFVTSVAGVVFYTVMPAHSGLSTAPDWLLGILFGIGGIAGMYCGARLQKFVPQSWIKGMISMIMLFLASRYILGFFAG